jgi:hypothetical protein
MHDQSKHAGASLDPTVKQHVVPEVADIAQRQRRLNDIDEERVDAATDNAHVTRLELRFRPIGLRAANDFVAAHHRHHGPTRGHKFSISVTDAQGQIRGVAIAGRPVARRLDDGAHLEVLRVCTDGTPNVCSMLYGAVRRAAKAMGYLPEHVITYTSKARAVPLSALPAGNSMAAPRAGVGTDPPDRASIPTPWRGSFVGVPLNSSTTDRMPNVGLSAGPPSG